MDIFLIYSVFDPLFFGIISSGKGNFMKRLKETKKWPAKWIHLASLFILVSSMFVMPVGILAETTTTSSSSTEAVLASEALSNSNDPVSGTLSTSGEDRVAAVNTPKQLMM